MKIPKWVKNLTKDAASTITGVAVGAIGGAATAYVSGGTTKEALIAGAGFGAASVVAGWAHNRGNKEPFIKE